MQGRGITLARRSGSPAHPGRPWRSGDDGSLPRALQQPRISDPLGPGDETLRWSRPVQLAHVAEQRSVGPERGEIFEQQRLSAPLPQDGVGELLDRPILAEQPGRGLTADAPDAGITVLWVADQRPRRPIGPTALIGRAPRTRTSA